ncbi:hypothetical protein BDZ89DRAFT_1159973 [Hymenopellis radicata]|nr:hypothetical protein BDZ89DRAFT_1159973 [Hymenopellis radicata]
MSSGWAFNLRTYKNGCDDSDSDSDANDGPAVGHEDTRLLNDLDISTREETVVYKPNPFSIAKINAAARNARESPTKKKPVKKVVDAAAKGKPNAIAQAFQRQAEKATKTTTNINNPLPNAAPSIPNSAPSIACPAPSISNPTPAPVLAPKPVSNASTRPPAPMHRHGPPTWPPAPFSSPAPRPTNAHSPMMHARSSPLQRTSLAPKTMPTQHAASKLNNANFVSNPRPRVSYQRIHSTRLTPPHDDERWTTLPSKKPKKTLPSVDRRATFKLPGLGGAPGQKSGISASSSSRVITFLPPPLDISKNSSLEPISQYRPLSPTTNSSDVATVFTYSPTKETPLTAKTPYRPLSPPTSDSSPQVIPQPSNTALENVIHVDLDMIGSRYRPTREQIRQRRKPFQSLLPGLDSCGKVWIEEEKANEIGIPIWRGCAEENYELDPLHPDRIAAIQDTDL